LESPLKKAQQLAFATAIATVALVTIGALVRATGSGLGCPDWPTCHGGVIPPGGQHPILEYTHRFVASVVGLMVIGVAVLAWRHYRHVPFTLWTATAAVPLVIGQGILGAIVVWWELPPLFVGTHMLTAMLVLACELAAAISMYAEDPVRRERLATLDDARVRPLGTLSLLALAWLSAVVWVGGYMAESGASTACAAWPTCNGFAVFPGADGQEITHMAHRYLVGVFAFLITPFVVMAWRRREDLPWAAELAVAAGALFLSQVIAGAVNVWFSFPDAVTVTHTALAASVWFVLSSAALLAWYRPSAMTAPRGAYRVEATS